MKRHALLFRPTFERFKASLDHFDVVSNLIQADDHEKSRMAIILIHSLAEGLMFIEAISSFDQDIYFSRVSVPKYSSQYRQKVFRFFDEKVDFCLSKSGLLTQSDAIIFKVLNFYRNAAYHRDTHNQNVISTIARIAFLSTLRLFENTSGNGGSGMKVSMEGISVDQSKSISKFVKTNNFIDYGKAAREAAQFFEKCIEADTDKMRRSFVADIKDRISKFEFMKENSLFCKTEQELDELFKKAAFELQGIEDDLSNDLKQMNYRITGQVEGIKPEREEYRLVEQRVTNMIEKAYKSFKPKNNSEMLSSVKNEMQLLEKATTLDSAINQYLEIDKKLIEIEILASHAENRIDEAIQFQIDLERGK